MIHSHKKANRRDIERPNTQRELTTFTCDRRLCSMWHSKCVPPQFVHADNEFTMDGQLMETRDRIEYPDFSSIETFHERILWLKWMISINESALFRNLIGGLFTDRIYIPSCYSSEPSHQTMCKKSLAWPRFIKTIFHFFSWIAITLKRKRALHVLTHHFKWTCFIIS